MSPSTRVPTQWLLIFGAAFTLTTACSPADSVAPRVIGAISATELAPAAARVGSDVSKALASLRNATAAFHDVDAAISSG